MFEWNECEKAPNFIILISNLSDRQTNRYPCQRTAPGMSCNVFLLFFVDAPLPVGGLLCAAQVELVLKLSLCFCSVRKVTNLQKIDKIAKLKLFPLFSFNLKSIPVN